MRPPLEDYYLVLGVAHTATVAEVRRAFRVLALHLHPDRAGPASTTAFQRIAEAYAVLSDSNSRAAYDGLRERAAVGARAPYRQRSTTPQRDRPPSDPGKGGPTATPGDGSPFEAGVFDGPGGRIGWRRPRRYTQPSQRAIINRLCGALDDLLSREVARRCPDGAVEITLSRAEADAGGVAAIDARVMVTCPTCSGLAEKDVLWCQRCHHAGTVPDDVTFHLSIPPAVRDRTVWTFPTDPAGVSPPLRVRVRVADAGRVG
jgi:molecular chaperone DnaJ